MSNNLPAITELLARYTWAHDSRDFDALQACFTESAVYTMRIADGPASTPTQGGEAIAALVKSFKEKQTDQRRHLITNVVADEVSEDAAIVRSYVTVFATEGDTSRLVTTGVCTDELVKTGGSWKFSRKDMHLDKGF